MYGRKTRLMSLFVAVFMMLALLAPGVAMAKGKHHKKKQRKAARIALATQAARDAFLAGYTAGASQSEAGSIGQQCNQAQILSLQCVLRDGIFVRVL